MNPLIASVIAVGAIAPVALAWRWVGSSLIHAYETRLAFWQGELERTDSQDTAKVAQVRNYMDYYTAKLVVSKATESHGGA